MTDEFKEQLKAAKVDVEKALERFMHNENLYGKFLKKFLRDETFRNLEHALNDSDRENAFMYAHTLKGIAGNFEFIGLLELLIPMTEQLRNGEIDNIKEMFDKLQPRYLQICKIIENI